jgi:fructokinase
MARVVAFGEALWDLLPEGPVLGGAPLNFAFRIGSLGHRAAMASALGNDALGERALARMRALGMETAFIQRTSRAPTGTVDVFLDANSVPDFTINSPAAYDHIALTRELEALAGEADCLCFGTVAQRGPESRRTLQGLLERFRGRFVLCDINLRKESYTGDTIESSLRRCSVAKLNQDELQLLGGLFGLQGRTIPERLEALMARFSLEYGVVTLGPAGACAASRSGERAYSPAFKINRVDTTGSGDAFTAGFLHALLRGDRLAAACRIGNAMGSLVAGQSGATQPLAPGAIEELLENGESEEGDPSLERYR